MNLHPPTPEPWDRHRREFNRLRIWLALLLVGNVAVALFNVVVTIEKVCP